MLEQLKDINFSLLLDLLAYDANNPLLFNTGLFLFLFLGFLLVYQISKKQEFLDMALGAAKLFSTFF